MRSTRELLFTVLCLFALAALSPARAQQFAATISDATGNQVNLTKVTTATISFHVGETDQQIPIAQIREIRAVPGSKTLEITLVAGTTLKGTADGKIEGQWELGSYSLELSKARQIVFKTAGGGDSKPPDWKQPSGYAATVNGTEVYGLKYEFTYRGCDRMWIPCKGYDAQRYLTRLPVLKGDVLYFVPFSSISRALVTEVELKDGAKLDGKIYAETKGQYGVSEDRRFEGRNRKLIGETTFGKIEFPIEKVKSVVFQHDKYVQPSKDDYNYRSRLEDGKFDETASKAPRLEGTIGTASGALIKVTRLDYFTVDDEGYIYAKSAALKVLIGEALNDVEMTRLAGLTDFATKTNQYGNVEALTAKISTKTGNTLAVQFKSTDICFGGPTETGYAKVCSVDLKSIEIK